ncbi:MAG: BON domain-containing protein [Halioglobus sp.]|nr:BON domain-containing protein [Halioglobus sp.]
MKYPDMRKLTCGSLIVGLAMAGGAQADQHRAEEKAVKDDSRVVHEQSSSISNAWRDGKLETVFLLNRHLNNFAIDTEVMGNKVVLSGKVESDVDKELAQELALGVEGIDEVDNRLMVVGKDEAMAAAKETDDSFAQKVDDATLVAEVKIKLLASDEIDGLAINVDAQGSTITLSGKVDSSARKDLAGKIAGNVDGVKNVDNKLTVATS